jgi:hypothetical protein
MARLPGMMSASPSTTTRSAENVISGATAASRKSGERRCASRGSLSVVTLAVRTTAVALPSPSPFGSTRVPSKSVKRPRIAATSDSVSTTSNSTAEWLGSTTQVPASPAAFVFTVPILTSADIVDYANIY